jgi:hypothetical protein
MTVDTLTSERAAAWSPQDVILYNLGLGAGGGPDSAAEARYLSKHDLEVLPTYALVAGMPDIGRLLGRDDFVQAGHELVIHSPLPPAAEAVVSSRIAETSESTVVVESTITDAVDARPLATNRTSLVVGGGDPPAAHHDSPAGRPDAEFTVATDRRQALIHGCLQGAAPVPGQRRLDGELVFGTVCKAIVDNLLGGQADRISRYVGRLVGTAHAGETLVVSAWDDGERILVSARTAERGEPVIADAAVELRDGPWTGALVWRIACPAPGW